MNTNPLITALLAVALCLPVSAASGQTGSSEAPAPDQEQPVYPPTSEIPQGGLQKRFQWSLNVGVPIFLDVDLQVIRPGADIAWVGGLDIGYVVFGIGAGVMFTPVNLSNFVDDNGNRGTQSPLTRLYFFPEIRFQLPNHRLVLPYLTGTFDANWWNLRETSVSCGFAICSRSSVYRFTPGFTGKVGAAFELKRGVKLDLGMKYSLSGKGDFFQQTRWWLTPYIGVLVRHKAR